MTEAEVGPSYCALMEELKSRVETIRDFSAAIRRPNTEQQHRHIIFMFEGLYLHLRKVCELLSLSLLLVHYVGSIDRSKGMLKEWRSDRLLDEIGRINPEGFPKPVQPAKWEAGSKETIEEMSPVFTADELKALYYRCGDIMHVGSLKNILRNTERALDQQLIQDWATKLVMGLNHHMIIMPVEKRVLLVRMSDPKTSKVSCLFASATK